LKYKFFDGGALIRLEMLSRLPLDITQSKPDHLFV